MFRDQARELCQRMAEETLERIRADRKRASVRVAAMLETIELLLLEADLQVAAVQKMCGAAKHVATRFTEELGLAPWAYITHCRMEIAGRALAASTVAVWRIGLNVGYLSGDSFRRAFTRWSGVSPTKFRKAAAAHSDRRPLPAPDEIMGRGELERALTDDLERGKARELASGLGLLQDRISANYQVLSPPVPTPDSIEPFMAYKLWQAIEHLPHAIQKSAIESQAPAYRTPVLFHLLCTRSIECGAENDVRGMQIANLALEAFLAVAEGERDINLFARAYAVSGFAFFRCGELEEAEMNLTFASRMLQVAGDDVNPVVVMEHLLYSAMVLIERGDSAMAAELTKASDEIYVALLKKLKQQLPAGGSGEPADDPA